MDVNVLLAPKFSFHCRTYHLPRSNFTGSCLLFCSMVLYCSCRIYSAQYRTKTALILMFTFVLLYKYIIASYPCSVMYFNSYSGYSMMMQQGT